MILGARCNLGPLEAEGGTREAAGAPRKNETPPNPNPIFSQVRHTLASELLHRKKRNLCCVKPLGLWQFVPAATRNNAVTRCQLDYSA